MATVCAPYKQDTPISFKSTYLNWNWDLPQGKQSKELKLEVFSVIGRLIGDLVDECEKVLHSESISRVEIRGQGVLKFTVNPKNVIPDKGLLPKGTTILEATIKALIDNPEELFLSKKEADHISRVGNGFALVHLPQG